MAHEREVVLKPFIDQADYMNERVSSGIELYRKGRLNIKVVDEDGNAVPEAKITVKQKNHEFRYGANLFALNEFSDPDESNEFKRLFSECFNLATLPFYWKTVEPEKGKTRYIKDSPHIYRRPTIDSCLEFCDQYGLEPKAHCLDYDSWTPEWCHYDKLEDVRKALYHRFEELSSLYAHRIPSWEVTNETLFSPVEANTVHYLQNDTLEWDFRTADKFFPQNKLIINDAADNIWPVFNGNRSAYYMLIERALSKGLRIDSIGMQFHFFRDAEEEKKSGVELYTPSNIYKVLDRYADFGLPVQITESTIPCFSPDYDDEDIQAEILKNLYSMWFSHPCMEALIYWDFVDGHCWTPYNIGFVKNDLTPKKAYYTIRDLFGKTWRTNLDTCTNSYGQASLKAFYGEYDITVHSNEKSVTETLNFSKNSKPDFTLNIKI